MNFIKKKIKPIENNPNLKDADYVLFILVSVLIIISIIFSYSLTIYTVEFFGYDQYHFFLRQSLVGIVSIFIMWFLAKTDPDRIIGKISWILLITFSLLMIAMPFLPGALVTASGGANRWIRLPGISLSPVEFFKIGFIYFLSWSFHRKVIHQPKKGLLDEALLLSPYFLVFFGVVFIIAFLQKDLGQVVLLGVILVVLLIFANRSFKIFLALGTIALVGLVGLIIAAPHRIKRIHSWWAMVQDGILSVLPAWAEVLRIDDLPEPYQVSHSLNAIHNGGILGQGVALGNLKLGFLSEVHTDFVLAGMIEEIGLIGLIFVVGILFCVVWRIFKISRRVENPIYHLFSLGIALMVIIAFLINSYGISGMIPIKGIAVPFLSYGGSSMLAMALAVGLVLSISRLAKDEIVKKNIPTKNVNNQVNMNINKVKVR
ncbi:FtsW/RodA/SpoVE family cell cycle protein [Aliarcobacter butzleri]|uniref:Probable peptidoglycan glycosyltransferase FtsW n=2 Tax=Aliarcobacter butzleri TaxID=28197 RepID=A0AAW6VS41_9BACT|nr:FtsW/RodA/SpoVE family cell cycle protein [Aliarcobacter butzleri]KLE02729.1 cell division protein FtsW [Aliarcobacter butzleri L348]MCG3668288.1 FtsW/RodA/SpoVE family cell cycle protein [Aliarcobacter butzleri]MDK2063085.1 FtsW/RodA/SpoVE family cell cycle protein [Aliarcobacter butzleri]MDK2071017.1 FtsW/RodA/SpoVE family cell cycle protein [Aliarcobacter butzleri]MDN5071246.1 FtsW/RodA/SpoVE family cell cycle protein [Aliarcobacter butzleri]